MKIYEYTQCGKALNSSNSLQFCEKSHREKGCYKCEPCNNTHNSLQVCQTTHNEGETMNVNKVIKLKMGFLFTIRPNCKINSYR